MDGDKPPWFFCELFNPGQIQDIDLAPLSAMVHLNRRLLQRRHRKFLQIERRIQIQGAQGSIPAQIQACNLSAFYMQRMQLNILLQI